LKSTKPSRIAGSTHLVGAAEEEVDPTEVGQKCPKTKCPSSLRTLFSVPESLTFPSSFVIFVNLNQLIKVNFLQIKLQLSNIVESLFTEKLDRLVSPFIIMTTRFDCTNKVIAVLMCLVTIMKSHEQILIWSTSLLHAGTSHDHRLLIEYRQKVKFDNCSNFTHSCRKLLKRGKKNIYPTVNRWRTCANTTRARP
jgi:hypothetical protein